MNRHLLRSILPASALLMLAGCVDDKYDLDNMDNTIGVNINDLVVPVNLESITLHNIMDLDGEGSIVEENYMGKNCYVFKKSGNFDSDEIHISTFTVNPPADQQPTDTKAHIDPMPPVGADVLYHISETKKEITYHVTDIDHKVSTIDNIESNDIRLRLQLVMDKSVFDKADDIILKGLQINFPTGLFSYANAQQSEFTDAKAYIIDQNNQKIEGVAKYDAQNGYVTISKFKCTSNVTTLQIEANKINLDAAPTNGVFDFETTIDVKKGDIEFITDNASTFPTNFDFKVYYGLGAFNISRFTGNIDYDIEGLDFDPVHLDDLPDVFAGDDTRIRIANPQLYVQIDNTCGQYGLRGEVGLKLTSDHARGSITYPLPENINIPSTPYVTDFALSPEGESLQPVAPYDKAAYLDKIQYTDLSNVLYGSEETGYGIPSTINVSFPDPVMKGKAQRFPLRPNSTSQFGVIPPVTGQYLFYAPLALADGSVIVYTGDDSGWADDTLDGLKIKNLTVTANALSDLPVTVTLKAFALDKEGHRMGECPGVTIAPGTEPSPITLSITPTDTEDVISGIDGIYYEATCVQDTQYGSPADVPALSPDMNIKLDNLKIKVNGSFEKDLDD